MKFRIRFLPTEMLSGFERFLRAGGNNVIYSEVDKNTIFSVFAFRGHKGVSAKKWLENSVGPIFVYEPIPEWPQAICDTVGSSRVLVFEHGLAEVDAPRVFAIAGDATTGVAERQAVMLSEGNALSYSQSGEVETVNVCFRAIGEVAADWPLQISVGEINIEGGEYELIGLFSDYGLLLRFETLFIGFHNVGARTEDFLRAARARLAQNHELIWSYPMVWECWKKRSLK